MCFTCTWSCSVSTSSAPNDFAMSSTMLATRSQKSQGYAASSAVGKLNLLLMTLGFQEAWLCCLSQNNCRDWPHALLDHSLVSLSRNPPCAQLWKSIQIEPSRLTNCKANDVAQYRLLRGFSTSTHKPRSQQN